MTGSKYIIYGVTLAMLPLLSTVRTEAQEARRMTLSQCVEYAMSHSPLITTADVRTKSLERDKKDAVMAFLPSLSAGVGQSASFGRSQDKTGVYRDVSSTSTSFQVGSSMTLYDGGNLWYAYKKSDLASKLSGYVVRETKDNITLRVVDAYIQLLLAKDIHEVARQRLELTRKSMQDIEAQVKVGRLSESRLLEIKTQFGSDELSVSETEADVRRAMKLLLYEIGAGDESEIITTDPSTDDILLRLEGTDVSSRRADWTLPSIALAEGELRKSEYDIKMARAGHLPSLSLNFGYNNSYYYNLDKQYQSLNTPFADQLKANGRSYVGLSLNIPIFSNGRTSSAVYRAKLQRTQLTADLIQKKQDEERNVALAKIDWEKSVQQNKMAGDNVTYASEAFRYADIQYHNGSISSYEWEQARNKESEARASYLRSIYTRLQRTIHLRYFNTGVIDLSLTE